MYVPREYVCIQHNTRRKDGSIIFFMETEKFQISDIYYDQASLHGRNTNNRTSATSVAAAARAGAAQADGSASNGNLGSGGGGDDKGMRRDRSTSNGGSVKEAACDTSVLQTLLKRYRPHAIWFFAPSTPCACVSSAVFFERGVFSLGGGGVYS